MSRFTISNNGKKVVYGFDRMLVGYFLEVHGPNGVDIGESLPIELEWSTNPMLCLSPIGETKSRSQIYQKMAELNLPKRHLSEIGLDLPFSEKN